MNCLPNGLSDGIKTKVLLFRTETKTKSKAKTEFQGGTGMLALESHLTPPSTANNPDKVQMHCGDRRFLVYANSEDQATSQKTGKQERITVTKREESSQTETDLLQEE